MCQGTSFQPRSSASTNTMFGRRLLVELAPGLLLVELASPLVELEAPVDELEAPVVKQEVRTRRISIKSEELALVRMAIRVH